MLFCMPHDCGSSVHGAIIVEVKMSSAQSRRLDRGATIVSTPIMSLRLWELSRKVLSLMVTIENATIVGTRPREA